MTSKEDFPFDIPQPKTKIGVQRQRDGTFHVFVNGEDQGVAAMDIPQVSCWSSLCTYRLYLTIILRARRRY